jgi:hypothetical protein
LYGTCVSRSPDTLNQLYFANRKLELPKLNSQAGERTGWHGFIAPLLVE